MCNIDITKISRRDVSVYATVVDRHSHSDFQLIDITIRFSLFNRFLEYTFKVWQNYSTVNSEQLTCQMVIIFDYFDIYIYLCLTSVNNYSETMQRNGDSITINMFKIIV